jgi:hypothetical protein
VNVHKKLGPFPVWAWGVAIAGGLVLGIYLRRRAASSSTNPNQAIGDYLAAAGGGGIADPNAGTDSGGMLAGILDQNQQVLDYLLSMTGGGSIPAIGDPATYEPTPVASAPSNVASSGGSGASPNPNPAAPAITEPTFTAAPVPAGSLSFLPGASQTLDVTSSGQYVGSFTGAPVLAPGAPASDLYDALGIAPSAPFTVLPGGSSGPNALLSSQPSPAPQPVYDLSGPAPVVVGDTSTIRTAPIGKIYAT